MWENIGYSCALLMVGCLSRNDIKEKRIPVQFLLVSGIVALLFLGISGKMTGAYIMRDVGPGLLLLLLSKITREGIGYGDGVVIVLIGLFCGAFFTVRTVGTAFFLSGIYALVLLWKRQRDTIPFLPFLLIAMEVVLLYE